MLPLALSACSSSASGPAAQDSGRESRSAPSIGTKNGARNEAPDHKVVLDAALTRSYAAPDLASFVSQAGATNVISGTVTAIRPLVSGPANTVETILTVSIERQRDADAPTVVEVREQGGVVSVAQVRSDFEGKLGRELTDEELAETVDYQFNGIEHARAGDRVLVVVADDTSVQKEGAYVSLARLVQEDTAGALSKSASSKSSSMPFTWPGEAPNPAWESVVDVESLM
ncbi:hypothetical protein [Streptomyces sp. SAI-144]|uniref:hypothetical protein n=1 Tax=Streptomyces sp. SAI-144 TaxID=2940544 RepID=UPI0024732DFD|nr:hypothetical protein [Streptomyces sp. SAI-144]